MGAPYIYIYIYIYIYDISRLRVNEKFLILRKIQQTIIKTVYWFACKVLPITVIV